MAPERLSGLVLGGGSPFAEDMTVAFEGDAEDPKAAYEAVMAFFDATIDDIPPDERGAYRFDDVKPGRYSVWAERGPATSLEKKLGGHRFTVAKGAAAPDSIRRSASRRLARPLRAITLARRSVAAGFGMVPPERSLTATRWCAFRQGRAGIKTGRPGTDLA